MASSLIPGAIIILLILISGYIIAGGILSITEMGISGQTEMKNINQKILHSDIDILYAHYPYSDSNLLVICASNNGTTSYSDADFDKTDLYIGYTYGKSEMTRLPLNSNTITIDRINDRLNQGFWDKDELINITVTGSPVSPDYVKIVTPTGAIASSFINVP